MSDLLKQIKTDYLLARRNKDSEAVALLSTLISDVEMVGKNKGREVTDDDVTATIKKFMKGITEVIRVSPTSTVAQKEKKILEGYTPTPPTEEELRARIEEILSHGDNTMGAIMKALKFVWGA